MASEKSELRKGPWTLEEDSLLTHSIASHGEGRWNLLARRSGLKRTGKSCRLRWLNYLKPDVKHGNLTPEEQLMILQLHSKWGNRWSRIAQHLPGRTDNEIKNYWRTRVQKQARQLKVDANGRKFREAVRFFWIPRLLQQMQSSQLQPSAATNSSISPPCSLNEHSLPASLSSDLKHDQSNFNCFIDNDCTCKRTAPFPEIPDFPTNPQNAFDNIARSPFLIETFYPGSGYDFESRESAAAAAGGFSHFATHPAEAENNWVHDMAEDLRDMDELMLITESFSER